jgi:hypothetical protein
MLEASCEKVAVRGGGEYSATRWAMGNGQWAMGNRQHLGLRRERSDFGERSVEPSNAYLDLPRLRSATRSVTRSVFHRQ